MTILSPGPHAPTDRPRRGSIPGRARGALLAVLAAGALIAPAIALGHATVTTSEPADGTTVGVLPDPIVLVFTEAITGESVIALHDPAGAEVATGTIDPADASRVTIATGDLTNPTPGAWEVRWTSKTDDGGIERGIVHFTLAEPTPPPATPTPSPSIAPTAPPSASPIDAPAPTVTVAPTESPAGAPGGETPAADSGSDLIVPIGAAIAFAIGAIWWLLRRRGSAA